MPIDMMLDTKHSEQNIKQQCTSVKGSVLLFLDITVLVCGGQEADLKIFTDVEDISGRNVGDDLRIPNLQGICAAMELAGNILQVFTRSGDVEPLIQMVLEQVSGIMTQRREALLIAQGRGGIVVMVVVSATGDIGHFVFC